MVTLGHITRSKQICKRRHSDHGYFRIPKTLNLSFLDYCRRVKVKIWASVKDILCEQVYLALRVNYLPQCSALPWTSLFTTPKTLT